MSDPEIIYEDENIAVINKPAGLMVHAVKTKDRRAQEPTLVDWLLKKYPEINSVGDDPELRPGIVHRLDKDTSGVMVIARNQATFGYFKALFQKHDIKKTYLAVVLGELKKKEGVINAPIGILTGSTRRSVRSAKMAKEAVTEYRVLENPESRIQNPVAISLLEVRPKTGRTHQIRVHLASIGHPILGDPLYGTQISRSLAPRLMLHALSLEFLSQDGRRMQFEAAPPKEFEESVDPRLPASPELQRGEREDD